MAQLAGVPDELHEQCRHTVAGVLARHDWRLLDREEFARRTADGLRIGEAGEPWAAAVNVYCHCLYAACRGEEGEERRERGFIELHRYLHDLSFRLAADMPDDLRQERLADTLERIWRLPLAGHKPGAFLAVAAMELRSVLRP